MNPGSIGKRETTGGHYLHGARRESQPHWRRAELHYIRHRKLVDGGDHSRRYAS